MGALRLEDDDKFTVAERSAISLVFERLRTSGKPPLLLYCSDLDGHPLVVFSGIFTEEDTEFIGTVMTEALCIVNERHAAAQ